MKVCSKCKIEKEFIEFSKGNLLKSGYNAWCKKCYKYHNIDYKREYNKKYRLENKDSINKTNNKYRKSRRSTNPLYKLKCNTSNLIRMSIKNQGYSKTSKTSQILGCSFEDFKIHLEQQFTEGMTWNNHGEWELDHIYPVSLAIDEQHIIKLNHYTNFQPLWWEDNNKKNNKI